MLPPCVHFSNHKLIITLCSPLVTIFHIQICYQLLQTHPPTYTPPLPSPTAHLSTHTSHTARPSLPVLLNWYQDFSGAGGQNQVFMIKVWYLMVKVGLHKGFPLMYCTRGGSRRLLLKIGPQW